MRSGEKCLVIKIPGNVCWKWATFLFGSRGCSLSDDPQTPHSTRKTARHGGTSIMLWGCFSSFGVGLIYERDHGYVKCHGTSFDVNWRQLILNLTHFLNTLLCWTQVYRHLLWQIWTHLSHLIFFLQHFPSPFQICPLNQFHIPWSECEHPKIDLFSFIIFSCCSGYCYWHYKNNSRVSK